jgi:hypothetical protein
MNERLVEVHTRTVSREGAPLWSSCGKRSGLGTDPSDQGATGIPVRRWTAGVE